jgi:hypothetical protein
MKKKLMVFALVAMAILSGVSVLAAAECEEELAGGKGVGLACAGGGGVWSQVCCGSACGTDYCIGSGTYVCCK